jgi:hypothetical protein
VLANELQHNLPQLAGPAGRVRYRFSGLGDS